MAQPTNIVTTTNIVGIREDLSDVIYNISPEDTPFFSACGRAKATNTNHEWQTDALRASADNKHVEGDDTIATARTPTVRLGNYTQIFKDAVVVSGTEEAVTKAGRQKEMLYQSQKVLKEQKLDIERALFLNNAKVAGTNVIPGELAGAGAWLTTNVNNVGSGGANPTGDGTDARTDGTQTAFTQADFDLTMQEIWTSGGRSKTKSVYLSPYQMNIALGFTGNNNQRATIAAKDGDVVNNMGMYVTPWGQVKFVMSTECRSRDVWIMSDDMWAIAMLRPTRNSPLAKTGDSDKREILTELTLECRNEKASGLVADCSES